MFNNNPYKSVSKPVSKVVTKDKSSERLSLSIDKNQELPHISQMIYTTLNVCGGTDDRELAPTRQAPFNMICLLLVNVPGFGIFKASGFFIAPRVVITAGHCIHTRGVWSSEIEVIPGAEGNDAPYGSQTSSELRSVEGWVNDKNRHYDYGAILLPDDTLYNHLGAKFNYNTISNNENYFNSGYPLDTMRIQKYAQGNIDSVDEYLIYYNIDTYSGNSGSPIYTETEHGYAVVGVHTYGQCPNHAVKVQSKVVGNWDNWIEESKANSLI